MGALGGIFFAFVYTVLGIPIARVADKANRPLVMTLSLHPFVMGQPYRMPSLRKALTHCVKHAKRDRVWWTTPGAIADFCYSLPPGTIPGEGLK